MQIVQGLKDGLNFCKLKKADFIFLMLGMIKVFFYKKLSASLICHLVYLQFWI